MTWHQVTQPTSASSRDVLALLGARPAAWLRPFLTLSIGLAAGGGQDEVVTTFRLGMPRKTSGGSGRARLTWHTRNHDELFTKFTGSFDVRSGVTGTSLSLKGQATGGDPIRNQQALESLTRLIAAAASTYYGVRPERPILLGRSEVPHGRLSEVR
jgi:hypothetical protein